MTVVGMRLVRETGPGRNKGSNEAFLQDRSDAGHVSSPGHDNNDNNDKTKDCVCYQ